MTAVVVATFVMFLAGTQPAAAQSTSEIATAVDQTGSFVEAASDAELDAAIQRANSNGIGFVWLDRTGGGSALVAGATS